MNLTSLILKFCICRDFKIMKFFQKIVIHFYKESIVTTYFQNRGRYSINNYRRQNPKKSLISKNNVTYLYHLIDDPTRIDRRNVSSNINLNTAIKFTLKKGEKWNIYTISPNRSKLSKRVDRQENNNQLNYQRCYRRSIESTDRKSSQVPFNFPYPRIENNDNSKRNSHLVHWRTV